MVQVIKNLGRRILTRAGQTPLQVFVRSKKGILVRFTNNGVHQNGFQDVQTYTLRALTKAGPVYVESNDFSETGIHRALERIRGEASYPEPVQKYARQNFVVKKEHFPLRLEKTPEMAAQAIKEAVRLIRQRQASANGYYSAYERIFYLADTAGREICHPSTAVRFGVTVIKGAGKGYFSGYHPDPGKLKVREVVREALELSEAASLGEVSLPAGEYECIFSPRAFLELIEPLRRHFDARLTQDGKSVFSGLAGKRVFSKGFTLTEDRCHPRQTGVPFDAEGERKQKVTLVDGGVIKELLAKGHSSRGLSEHPFYPQHLVVKEGRLRLKEIIKKIRRGVFINKIWYHALVREQLMEVTGLATAGSVYIEGGKIRGRTVHLRYHDSLFSLLDSVIATSREQILLKDGEFGAVLFPYLWVSRLRIV